jgi:hypothetical protein
MTVPALNSYWHERVNTLARLGRRLAPVTGDAAPRSVALAAQGRCEQYATG